MPTRSASARIVSPSGPDSSRSARAAAMIWVRRSVTDPAVRRTESIADTPVDPDVREPAEPGHEPTNAEQAQRREDDQREAPFGPVQEVVQGNGSTGHLPLGVWL